MTKVRINPRWFTALGLAGALASPAASGCSGESDGNGKAANAGSSASGSGATSNGGGSSGAPSGGSGGDSSGATSGSGGDSRGATGGSAGTEDTGGAAGESGGESSGGSSGAMGSAGRGGSGAGKAGSGGNPGGSAGAGGSGGSSGMSGAGGSGGGSAGTIGVLGTPCAPRGALACAGNHQKLTVLCGGNDTWQANQTCGEGQFCDSTPGPNVGICRPELTECADGPGTKWCDDDDKTLITCGPDAVSTVNQACIGACHNEVCRDVSVCPVWDDYDQGAACSRDCGMADRTLSCGASNISCTGYISVNFTFGPRAVIRTPFADSPCTQCNGTVAYLAVIPNTSSRLRVTVPAPWRVSQSSFCGALPQCAIFSSGTIFYVVSSSLDDGPVNVVVETVDSSATCPP
jgi:hypothetical protein